MKEVIFKDWLVLYSLTDDETRKEVMEAIVPNLLLAKAMGIFKEKVSKQTGRPVLCYTPLDEDGMPDFENEVRLGSSIEKSIAKVTPETAFLLEKLVKSALAKDYRHIDRQAELRKAVSVDVTSVMEAHDNDSEDETVQAFSKAFKQVKAMINALNED